MNQIPAVWSGSGMVGGRQQIESASNCSLRVSSGFHATISQSSVITPTENFPVTRIHLWDHDLPLQIPDHWNSLTFDKRVPDLIHAKRASTDSRHALPI